MSKIDNLKALVSSGLKMAEAVNNKDIINNYMEVRNMVLDLQDQIAEQRKTIEDQSRTIENYQKQADIEGDMIRYTAPVYRLRSDGNNQEIFYCYTCWGKDHRKIQVISFNDHETYTITCPSCDMRLIGDFKKV